MTFRASTSKTIASYSRGYLFIHFIGIRKTELIMQENIELRNMYDYKYSTTCLGSRRTCPHVNYLTFTNLINLLMAIVRTNVHSKLNIQRFNTY